MTVQTLDDLPVQLILPLWLPHEIAVMLEQQRKKFMERSRRKPAVKKLVVHKKTAYGELIDGICETVLDLPFGPSVDEEISDLGDPYAEHVEASEPFIKEGSDVVSEEWSEEAIEQLHEGVLLYSLRLLNARGNGKEKKDLLRWVFDPATMAVGQSVKPGDPITWKFIPSQDVPFSFELCCRLAGYDPDRVREGLAPVLKEMGLGALLKEIENARNTEQAGRSQCYSKNRGSEVPDTVHFQFARGAGKSRADRTEAGLVGST